VLSGLLDRAASIVERRFLKNAFLPVLLFFPALATPVLLQDGRLQDLAQAWDELSGTLNVLAVVAYLALVWFLAAVVASQWRNIIRLFEGYPLVRIAPGLCAARPGAPQERFRALSPGPARAAPPSTADDHRGGRGGVEGGVGVRRLPEEDGLGIHRAARARIVAPHRRSPSNRPALTFRKGIGVRGRTRACDRRVGQAVARSGAGGPHATDGRSAPKTAWRDSAVRRLGGTLIFALAYFQQDDAVAVLVAKRDVRAYRVLGPGDVEAGTRPSDAEGARAYLTELPDDRITLRAVLAGDPGRTDDLGPRVSDATRVIGIEATRAAVLAGAVRPASSSSSRFRGMTASAFHSPRPRLR
jgi:hypothetical protein